MQPSTWAETGSRACITGVRTSVLQGNLEWTLVRVYMGAAWSMFEHMIFTVLAVYYVLTLGLNPLQLVLAGTVMVIPLEMAHEVLITAEEIEAKQGGQRADLLAGMSMAEVYRKHRRM